MILFSVSANIVAGFNFKSLRVYVGISSLPTILLISDSEICFPRICSINSAFVYDKPSCSIAADNRSVCFLVGATVTILYAGIILRST